MNKTELRKHVRLKIRQLDPDKKRIASEELSENIKSFLPSLNSNTNIGKDMLLGGFSPMDDELNWHCRMLDTNYRPAIPSIKDDGSMEFHKISWKLLKRDFMGLSLDMAFPLVRPSVLIIPGLSFSEDGKRLGRGKGFYDKYLADKDVFKIGVCAQIQMSEEIEIQEHDILMDAVITEKNIYIRGN